VFTRAGRFAVRVHFLDPFDPGEHPHRKAISAGARERIRAELARLLGHEVD
jgi:1-acyl-sn-glycerol-3-phosphate acyltransferase